MHYTHSSHSVYLLTYHFVFVVKYRCSVITDEIGDAMKLYIAKLCKKSGCELISAETDRDHIHLLVSMPPDMAPSTLVTILKSQTSRMVRAEYGAHVKKFLWGKSPFWSNSYFAATTGSTAFEKVKEYIDSQRTEEHHHKYHKKRGNSSSSN